MTPLDTINEIGSGALSGAGDLVEGPVGKFIMVGLAIGITVAIAGVIFGFVRMIKKG